jgi:putative tricarboxylic transport membrane protein
VSQGDMSIFFMKKLVGTMTVLALLLLFWPLISWLYGKIRGKP